MNKRNNIVEDHYKKNFDRYVKIAKGRFNGRIHISEDAVQDSYERALTYFSCFDPEKRDFSTWFNTIFNNCVNDLRQLDRGLVDIEKIEELPDLTVGIDDEIKRDIKLYVDKFVPYPKGDVILCYFYRGMTAKEISFLFDRMSPTNVWQIISRFRKDFIQEYTQ